MRQTCLTGQHQSAGEWLWKGPKNTGVGVGWAEEISVGLRGSTASFYTGKGLSATGLLASFPPRGSGLSSKAGSAPNPTPPPSFSFSWDSLTPGTPEHLSPPVSAAGDRKQLRFLCLWAFAPTHPCALRGAEGPAAQRRRFIANIVWNF